MGHSQLGDDDDDEERCPISKEAFWDNESVWESPNENRRHYKPRAAYDWLQANRTDPVTRQPVSMEEVNALYEFLRDRGDDVQPPAPPARPPDVQDVLLATLTSGAQALSDEQRNPTPENEEGVQRFIDAVIGTNVDRLARRLPLRIDDRVPPAMRAIATLLGGVVDHPEHAVSSERVVIYFVNAILALVRVGVEGRERVARMLLEEGCLAPMCALVVRYGRLEAEGQATEVVDTLAQAVIFAGVRSSEARIAMNQRGDFGELKAVIDRARERMLARQRARS